MCCSFHIHCFPTTKTSCALSGGRAIPRAAAEADGERDEQRRDQEAEKRAHADEEKVEEIDLCGEGRGLLGKEREPGMHGLSEDPRPVRTRPLCGARCGGRD